MYLYFWQSLEEQHYVSDLRRLITHAEKEGSLARAEIERGAKPWTLFICYVFK